MGMTTGQLLAGAGNVSSAMRTEEERARNSRLNQLKVEEENRRRRMYQEMAQIGGVQQAAVPAYALRTPEQIAPGGAAQPPRQQVAGVQTGTSTTATVSATQQGQQGATQQTAQKPPSTKAKSEQQPQPQPQQKPTRTLMQARERVRQDAVRAAAVANRTQSTRDPKAGLADVTLGEKIATWFTNPSEKEAKSVNEYSDAVRVQLADQFAKGDILNKILSEYDAEAAKGSQANPERLAALEQRALAELDRREQADVEMGQTGGGSGGWGDQPAAEQPKPDQEKQPPPPKQEQPTAGVRGSVTGTSTYEARVGTPNTGGGASAPSAPLKQTDYYRANPQAVSDEMQSAMRRRNEMARYANVLLRAQTPEAMQSFLAMKQQIDALDDNMTYLAGMQGLQELVDFRDPRRLEAVLSYKSGNQYRIQPRQDGKYNLLSVEGGVIHDGLSENELGRMAYLRFSPEAREREAEFQAKAAELAMKEGYQLQRETSTAVINAIGKIRAAYIKGAYSVQAAMIAAKAEGMDVKFDSANGFAMFSGLGGHYLLDLQRFREPQTDSEGNVLRIEPQAQQVGGLPSAYVPYGIGGGY